MNSFNQAGAIRVTPRRSDARTPDGSPSTLPQSICLLHILLGRVPYPRQGRPASHSGFSRLSGTKETPRASCIGGICPPVAVGTDDR
jgi:hypothetical protein